MNSAEEVDGDEDWSAKLIKTVQSKPALYDKRVKQYGDRTAVNRLWAEVFEAMTPNWHELTPQEKSLKGQEIQQRWRNLRTCFKREVNKQTKYKSGPKAFKRRKYIYFDRLKFLLPLLEETKAIKREPSPPGILEDDSRNDEEHEYEFEITTTEPQIQSNTFETQHRATSIYEQQHQSSDDIDEDRLFLLSLVPAFKRMTNDQKIEAKVEFLNVIRRIMQTGYVK